MKEIINNLRALVTPFKVHVLRTAKAWIAAGMTALVAWLSTVGVQVPNEVEQTGVVFVTALVAWFVAWLIPNRK